MNGYRFSMIAACASALGLLATTVPTSQIAAQQVSFEGKTIKVLIGSKPGGGTTRTSRLVGTHIVRFLPGKPDVIYQNMPGGGGIKATNYFYNVVEPDGTTVLGSARSKLSPLTLRRPAAKYDPTKYNFIGGTAGIGTIVMIRKEAKPRLTDSSAKPVVYGAKDGSRSGAQVALWGKEYLGWNVKWVVGYQGTPAVLMAGRRGEIDLFANQNLFKVKPLLQEADVEAIAQIGIVGDDGSLIPRPQFSDVPVFEKMIRPKLDAKAEKAFDGWLRDLLADKWFVLPPKTPDDIVQTYRTAFEQMRKDSEFVKAAKKQLGVDYSIMSGKTLQKLAKELAGTTDEELEFFVNLAKKHKLPLK